MNGTRLVRRVLCGLFAPVTHGQNDFAERFPSLGGGVLDMERVSCKDFPGEGSSAPR
jgi:hypothetical protein